MERKSKRVAFYLVIMSFFVAVGMAKGAQQATDTRSDAEIARALQMYEDAELARALETDGALSRAGMLNTVYMPDEELITTPRTAARRREQDDVLRQRGLLETIYIAPEGPETTANDAAIAATLQESDRSDLGASAPAQAVWTEEELHQFDEVLKNLRWDDGTAEGQAVGVQDTTANDAAIAAALQGAECVPADGAQAIPRPAKPQSEQPRTGDGYREQGAASSLWQGFSDVVGWFTPSGQRDAVTETVTYGDLRQELARRFGDSTTSFDAGPRVQEVSSLQQLRQMPAEELQQLISYYDMQTQKQDALVVGMLGQQISAEDNPQLVQEIVRTQKGAECGWHAMTNTSQIVRGFLKLPPLNLAGDPGCNQEWTEGDNIRESWDERYGRKPDGSSLPMVVFDGALAPMESGVVVEYSNADGDNSFIFERIARELMQPGRRSYAIILNTGQQVRNQADQGAFAHWFGLAVLKEANGQVHYVVTDSAGASGAAMGLKPGQFANAKRLDNQLVLNVIAQINRALEVLMVPQAAEAEAVDAALLADAFQEAVPEILFEPDALQSTLNDGQRESLNRRFGSSRVKNFTQGDESLLQPRFAVGFQSSNQIRGSGYDNQDAASIIPLGLGSQAPVFVSVCDGHGQEPQATIIARAVSTMFPQYLLRVKREKGFNWNAEHLYQEAAARLQPEMVQLQQGKDAGATATTALIHENNVTFANVGDSRALLIKKGKLAFATRDHKPGDDFERQRIESVGGQVVVYGVPRVGGLAVSRTFGDAGQHAQGVGVTEQPEVATVPFESGDILVLASDGLWDTAASKTVVGRVMQGMQQGRSLDEIAEDLVEFAYDRRSADDITVLIVQKK